MLISVNPERGRRGSLEAFGIFRDFFSNSPLVTKVPPPTKRPTRTFSGFSQNFHDRYLGDLRKSYTRHNELNHAYQKSKQIKVFSLKMCATSLF